MGSGRYWNEKRIAWKSSQKLTPDPKIHPIGVSSILSRWLEAEGVTARCSFAANVLHEVFLADLGILTRGQNRFERLIEFCL